MKCNVNKCVLVRCFCSPSPVLHGYLLDDHILDERDEHFFLGVLLHKSLSWCNHIAKTATKASQVFNFLRCNLNNCSYSAKASAYLTIVRPIMEHASSVWDPHQQCDIQAIDKIQRRAAQWVMSDYGRHISVSSMLEFLNWPTLESRRRISRLQAIYKGIYKLFGLSIPYYFLPTQYPTRHHHPNHFMHLSSHTSYSILLMLYSIQH